MNSREDIARDLRQNQFERAVEIANQLLIDDPENDDLLGLIAIAYEGLGEDEKAEFAFKSALNFAKDDAYRVRYAGNYAAFLIERGREHDARIFLDRAWNWPISTTELSAFTNAALNLAQILVACDLSLRAIELLRRVMKAPCDHFDLFKFYIELLSERGFHEEAYQTIRNAPINLQSHNEFICLRAFVAGKSGRYDEANAAVQSYVRDYPVYLTRRPHEGKIGVVVINPHPTSAVMLKDPIHRHFVGNFPPQLVSEFAKKYVFDSIYAPCEPNSIRELNIDRPSICINNFVNAETIRSNNNFEKLNKIEKIIEQELKLPIINSVKKAGQCTRQLTAKLLNNIDGLILPKIERYRFVKDQIPTLIQIIENDFNYPVILRGTKEQIGANMHLCKDAKEITEILSTMNSQEFYIIEFCSKSLHIDVYRKIRAAFVNGAPIIIRNDYSPFWKIHSRYPGISTADAGRWAQAITELYEERPDLLQETEKSIINPESYFGTQVMNVLQKIGSAIPLEIFGLDFDVSDRGEVIFFEANATMNMYPIAATKFPFPTAGIERLSDAIQRYFDALSKQTE